MSNNCYFIYNNISIHKNIFSCGEATKFTNNKSTSSVRLWQKISIIDFIVFLIKEFYTFFRGHASSCSRKYFRPSVNNRFWIREKRLILPGIKIRKEGNLQWTLLFIGRCFKDDNYIVMFHFLIHLKKLLQILAKNFEVVLQCRIRYLEYWILIECKAYSRDKLVYFHHCIEKSFIMIGSKSKILIMSLH